MTATLRWCVSDGAAFPRAPGAFEVTIRMEQAQDLNMLRMEAEMEAATAESTPVLNSLVVDMKNYERQEEGWLPLRKARSKDLNVCRSWYQVFPTTLRTYSVLSCQHALIPTQVQCLYVPLFQGL